MRPTSGGSPSTATRTTTLCSPRSSTLATSCSIPRSWEQYPPLVACEATWCAACFSARAGTSTTASTRSSSTSRSSRSGSQLEEVAHPIEGRSAANEADLTGAGLMLRSLSIHEGVRPQQRIPFCVADRSVRTCPADSFLDQLAARDPQSLLEDPRSLVVEQPRAVDRAQQIPGEEPLEARSLFERHCKIVGVAGAPVGASPSRRRMRARLPATMRRRRRQQHH